MNGATFVLGAVLFEVAGSIFSAGSGWTAKDWTALSLTIIGSLILHHWKKMS